MNKEYQQLRLKDFIQFNPKEKLSKGSIARKITMEHIVPYNRYVSSNTFEEYKGGSKFRNGDTIMARITPCLENGKTAYISSLDQNELAFGSTEFIVLREVYGVSDKKYIYYLMSTPEIRNVAIKSMVGSSGRQRVQQNVLENYIVCLPSLNEQIRIANILSSLDDKIELNRRINENLEQQAQALFKSWFVDNSNPNWNEITLSEIASFIGGYSYKGKELADSSNIAMATIKNFGRNGGFKADGFKDINPSAKLKEYHNVDLFDILVAHTDVTQNADIIGNAELLLTCDKYDSVIFSMDLVKVTPKKNFPYRFLLAAMLKNKYFKKHCLGYVNGTTVLHLDKKALPEFETKIPSASEAKWMNCVLASYYKRIAEILQENDRLINLRDTLLPKLMSGKLRFSEIETEDSSALKD